MEVYIALLCVLLVLWLAWRWQRTSFFQKLGVPGPKPNLFFGNLLELYSKGPIVCHKEWVKKHGRVLGYFYGMTPVLLVTDPHLLKNIFIRDFNKFINRESFNPLFKYHPSNKVNQSILQLPGQAWKDVRSVLTPTFTVSKMKQMAGSMNSSIDAMLDIMKSSEGKEIEIFDTFQRLTMDVITKTAFGVKTDVQTNLNSNMLHATKVLFANPFRDPLIFIGTSFPLLRRICNEMQGWVLSFLNRGRHPAKMLRKGIERVLNHRRENADAKKKDLLQLMIDSKIVVGNTDTDITKLEAGNEFAEKKLDDDANSDKDFRTMTDAEIISSALVVLLAGYETTSTALAYTVYLLSKHPEAQEELFDEIEQLIQSGQKLEYATVNKLPYLDRVINESLRIYPPINLFTNRYAVEEARYNDLFIPKGTLIQAPVHLIHHDAEFWTDPEQFDPERFINKPNSDGITYLPFGVGPRNCLGMRFAQLEIKLTLAHIIRKFNIRLGEKSKGELYINARLRTLSPSRGVYVRLEERSA